MEQIDWDARYYKWHDDCHPWKYANKGCESWTDAEWKEQWPMAGIRFEYDDEREGKMQEVHPRWTCGHRGSIYVYTRERFEKAIQEKCVRCQAKDKWIAEEKRKIGLDKEYEQWV